MAAPALHASIGAVKTPPMTLTGVCDRRGANNKLRSERAAPVTLTATGRSRTAGQFQRHERLDNALMRQAQQFSDVSITEARLSTSPNGLVARI